VGRLDAARAFAPLRPRTLLWQLAVLVLAEVYRRIERARAELLEARTRAKAIDRLRDRRYDDWRRALSKRESAAVDDLTTIRAAWRVES